MRISLSPQKKFWHENSRRVLIDWINRTGTVAFTFGSRKFVGRLECHHLDTLRRESQNTLRWRGEDKNRYEEVQWTIEEEQKREKSALPCHSTALALRCVGERMLSVISTPIFLQWNGKILLCRVHVCVRARKSFSPNAFIKLECVVRNQHTRKRKEPKKYSSWRLWCRDP